MTDQYHATMGDDQRNLENDTRREVEAVKTAIRAIAKSLYTTATKSVLRGKAITEFAEELEIAVSDYAPNDAQWAEAISEARNG